MIVFALGPSSRAATVAGTYTPRAGIDTLRVGALRDTARARFALELELVFARDTLRDTPRGDAPFFRARFCVALRERDTWRATRHAGSR
jgi:hypothetical protein